ncbi:capsular polysaccharide synthesis protein [Lactobacillus delbrueckii subsp. bulgaricus]
MMNISKKLNKVGKRLSLINRRSMELSHNFNIKLGIYEWERSLFRDPKYTIGKHAHIKTHQYVKKRLEKEFSNLIDSYQGTQKVEKILPNAPIWIFWWQGLDSAPDVVKKCVETIMENSGGHPINLVTKENYKDIVHLPDNILKKLEMGNITLTHFSDILRMALLYEYGGIWMDCTLFMTSRLPANLCDYSFYTIRHGMYSDYHVCQGKWTGFFLAMSKGNPLAKFCRDMFYEYWKKYDKLMCYLLIDVVMLIAYDKFPWARLQIDQVPVNNARVFELQSLLNKKYDEQFFRTLTKSTTIFKLSYKGKIINKKGTFASVLNVI